MHRLPVVGGYVEITDDVVEADISVPKAFYRFYEQTKIESGALTLAVVALALAAVFEYPPGSRVIVAFGVIVLAGYLLLAFLVNEVFRPYITTERMIPRDAIKLIAYKEGGKLRRPSFAIVYTENGDQKARNVFLFPELIGKDDPLDRVLPPFQEAGIETKPVSEVES